MHGHMNVEFELLRFYCGTTILADVLEIFWFIQANTRTERLNKPWTPYPFNNLYERHSLISRYVLDTSHSLLNDVNINRARQ